jgi:hypothetical protein
MAGPPTASSRNTPAKRVFLHALLMFGGRLRGCCRLPNSNTVGNAFRPGSLRIERLALRSRQSSLGLGGRGRGMLGWLLTMVLEPALLPLLSTSICINQCLSTIL